ncbi:MAG TPA: TraB/GumN family protein [Spirochaetia bacterium]|nr:TraB/GumN family protein [Spirochaetia bacterium]
MNQGTERLSFGDRTIVLVGTAHVSRESVDEVRRAIDEEAPDRVCVELDDGRHASLTQGNSWQNLNVGKVIREGKGFLLMANLVLASFQRRLGSELGVRPGEEMLAAIDAAREKGIPFSLCDRNIQITLRRAWASSGAWGRMKMLAAMLSSVFVTEKLSPEDIEKLKQKDVLQEMMEELAAYLPGAKQALIDERDTYLAARIFQAEGKKIIAVVGAGHLAGIARHLQAFWEKRESDDVSSLDQLPERSWVGRILPWAIPAIILGLFVLAVVRAGWSLSLEMFWRWLLIHGGLAAVGSLLAGAHPLTILVAFVGAPIGTFNPFGKVGLFTGVAEAFLRKPRVRDLEGLAQDVATFKGFYTNRVTHILIVFFMSTLGAAIGNIIAIPWLTALLRGAR